MPCAHKFQEYLDLGRINFLPETLIVGTFNPTWPVENNALWFYGRTHDQYGNQNNNFWDVLPRVYDETSLINGTTEEWKEFCCNKKVAITDLITCIDDADETIGEHVAHMRTYSDKSIATRFEDHGEVDIVSILQDHPTIRNVYLTRGIGEAFWRDLWRPVVRYAAENDLHERRLLTPSGYAFYQHGRYNKNNPENQIPVLSDFILHSWKQQWHDR